MKTRIFEIVLRLSLLAALVVAGLLLVSSYGQAAAATQGPDQVALHLLDQHDNPVSNVTANLVVYQFDASGQTATAFPSGSCVTDRNGRCQIDVSGNAPKDASGFLRGTLDLGGYGKRSVIWPGGLFEIELHLNPAGKLESDTEAAPFDYDEAGGVQVVQPRPPLYWVGIIISMLFLGVALYLYRRAKAQ